MSGRMGIVPLSPTHPSRERILVVGPWGAGKSYSWIKLAQWLKRTGSTAKVFVLFTDFSMERYLEGWDHPNIVPVEVGDYKELLTASDKFVKQAKRDDWLVVDLISDPYDWVKDLVAERVTGMSMSEWALDVKGEMEKISGNYGSNWGMINGMYRDWFNKRVGRFPGHVLATARAKEFMRDNKGAILGNKDEKLVDAFGKYNLYPQGHSDLPYQFHTVLLLQKAKEGDYRISTIRERTMPDSNSTRLYLKGEGIRDFVPDYLVKVAGWKMEEIYLKAFS